MTDVHTNLFVVSTPWNFINAFAHAERISEQRNILFYVDYPVNEENPYLIALDDLRKSPFESKYLFHGKFKGLVNKWMKRRKQLRELMSIVADIKPNTVFVGSDRRIEFQCAMTEAVKHNAGVKGIYMDEGLFTYDCRRRSQTWSDRVLDSWVKRFMYPVDWKHPATIGASDWIQEGWVLNPDEACPILKDNIDLHMLCLDWFNTDKFAEFTQLLITPDDFEALKKPFDVLLILPHPSQINQSLKQRLDRVVRDIQDKGLSFRIKRHPRDNNFNKDWVELPKHLPLELLLPWLEFSELIGAQSTATMTAKLLKKNVRFKEY